MKVPAKRAADLDLVPPVLRPIARELGLAAALEVAQKVGGTRVLVPNKPKPGMALVEAIGLDATRILAESRAAYIPIPRCVRLLAAMRAQAIQADNRSANILAREYRMTERQVRAIRTGPRIFVGPGAAVSRRDDRQLDLLELLLARRA